MSIVFAASHPERVSALVLYGGVARYLWAPDYPFGIPERAMRRRLAGDAEAFMSPGWLVR
jgi:pimeloyl-ACP methyl ester carboxylesterase